MLAGPSSELPRRTGRRTVPDMFGRHRTTHDRTLAAMTATAARAFDERLTAVTVTLRTDPPRVDPRNLRRRLGGPASAALRDRLDRRLSPT